MKKLLETIEKKIKEDLYIFDSAFMGDDLRERMGVSKSAEMIYHIGLIHIYKRRTQQRVSKIEEIRKYCISELKGSFHEDYLKKWDNSDLATKYHPNLVFEYILGCWSNFPTPEIDIEVACFVSDHYELESKLTEGLMKFAPEAGPYNIDEEGEAHKLNLSDVQINNSLKDGSMQANIEEYNFRIDKIKILAENKGNLAEIIRLTEL